MNRHCSSAAPWSRTIPRRSLWLGALLLVQLAVAHGQTAGPECKTNLNAPPTGFYSWSRAAEVKVYFVRGMFTAEQQQQLIETMDYWTTAAKKTGADVSFTYAGETDGTRNCDNCLTVTRREINKYDPKHYAFFRPFEMKKNGTLRSASIEFDFATTAPEALHGFMAHELAHGMGLWDCPKCKKKQSIMRSFPSINKDNGLTEPSACDLQVMREVFESQGAGQPRSTAQVADSAQSTAASIDRGKF